VSLPGWGKRTSLKNNYELYYIVNKIIMKDICSVATNCGGCDLQISPYSKQLKYKQSRFLNQIKDLEHSKDIKIFPIRGMEGDPPLHYRNKIRFGFDVVNKKINFTRHNRKTDRSDIIVDKCFLQSERSNQILKIVVDWANSHQLSVFKKDDNPTGWLKHLLVREGKLTDDLMIDLITTKGKISKNLLSDLVIRLTDFDPLSLFQTETQGNNNSEVKLNHLHGSDFITDQIGDYTFKISRDSFFQTNTVMAKVIYDTVLDFIDPKPTDTVYDLYCGTGTIGIYLSKHAKKVTGIESCQSAINNAQENAKINKIKNIDFICQPVEKYIDWVSGFGLRDPIIIDPPRAGLDSKTRDFLMKSKAKKIIYVSCNPQTLVRDLKYLIQNSKFEIQKIQPIDCFPHTHHLESVTLLEKI